MNGMLPTRCKLRCNRMFGGLFDSEMRYLQSQTDQNLWTDGGFRNISHIKIVYLMKQDRLQCFVSNILQNWQRHQYSNQPLLYITKTIQKVQISKSGDFNWKYFVDKTPSFDMLNLDHFRRQISPMLTLAKVNQGVINLCLTYVDCQLLFLVVTEEHNIAE